MLQKTAVEKVEKRNMRVLSVAELLKLKLQQKQASRSEWVSACHSQQFPTKRVAFGAISGDGNGNENVLLLLADIDFPTTAAATEQHAKQYRQTRQLG